MAELPGEQSYKDSGRLLVMETEKEKELYEEWIVLIRESKEAGMSKQDVLAFFKENVRRKG